MPILNDNEIFGKNARSSNFDKIIYLEYWDT